MLNSLICTYCANAHNEPCITQCAPKRSYRAFEPRPLREWEQQPTFPVADFLQMTAREARVLLGLYLFWQFQYHAPDGRLPPLNSHRRPSAINSPRRCSQWPTNR